ncbi:MAG: hypothetical protein OXG24_05900 [Gammaproteobacteria bacterium]|nr:hypothetical protein [Gammaproteobacteria bacterium]
MNWIRIVMVSLAVGFLIQPVAAHHGQPVDTDKDGTPNMEDVCWDQKNHYRCLKRAGLWEWPVRLGTMQSPQAKFESIRRCMDLSDWKNTLVAKATYWVGIAAIAAGAGGTGVGLIGAGIAVVTAGSFASAAENASDVYDRLCDGR